MSQGGEPPEGGKPTDVPQPVTRDDRRGPDDPERHASAEPNSMARSSADVFGGFATPDRSAFTPKFVR